MTTYTVPDLEVSTTDADGTAVSLKFKAGDVTPQTEREAQAFADLAAAGIITVAAPAAAKAAKSKPAAAEETE